MNISLIFQHWESVFFQVLLWMIYESLWALITQYWYSVIPYSIQAIWYIFISPYFFPLSTAIKCGNNATDTQRQTLKEKEFGTSGMEEQCSRRASYSFCWTEYKNVTKAMHFLIFNLRIKGNPGRFTPLQDQNRVPITTLGESVAPGKLDDLGAFQINQQGEDYPSQLLSPATKYTLRGMGKSRQH